MTDQPRLCCPTPIDSEHLRSCPRWMPPPTIEQQMQHAISNQLAHVTASVRTNRHGWTRQQWIEDAARQFNDLDGSVMDLLNGHIEALLDELDELDELREDRDRARLIAVALEQELANVGQPTGSRSSGGRRRRSALTSRFLTPSKGPRQASQPDAMTTMEGHEA